MEKELNILLIEDDEDDYILTTSTLNDIKNLKVNVTWKRSYTEGLNELCKGKYDICLLDYRLGKNTGLELLQEAIDSTCKIPVILLTGESNPEIDRNALKSGASDYLVKGKIDHDILERTIRYAIERNKAALELKEAQEELENKVQERTIQLKKLNDDLKKEINERKKTEKALKEREDRYRAFVTQSSEGIWRFELEKPIPINLPINKQIDMCYQYGYLAECNDVMAKMYGFSKADDIIGARLGDLLVRDDPKNTEYLIHFIKSGYRASGMESYEIDKSGHQKCFQNNLVGIIENGYVIRGWGTQVDITEQKKHESALHFLAEASKVLSSSLEYQATLKSVANLAITYIADWCTVSMVEDNGTLTRLALAHKSAAKIKLAEKYQSLYPPEPTDKRGIYEVLRTGKSEMISQLPEDHSTSIKDKRRLSMIKKIGLESYMIVPIKIQNKILGVISLISSEQGRHYKELDLQIAEALAERAGLAIENALLYQKANETLRLREEFISIASHELKTPLTSMKAFSQILQKYFAQKHETKAVDHMYKMHVQIDRLSKLVEDLLNVNKIKSGQLEYVFQPLNLDSIIETIIKEMRIINQSHDIILKGKSNATIFADQDRISQVLVNLIGNAIKYSPDAKKIEVSVHKGNEEVIIAIKDYGIGIAQEEHEKIFERFYRAKGTREQTFPGMGLGLYITSKIVQKHKGKIWVESDKDKGSTFYIKLPILKKKLYDHN
ncbi:MAG TPA: ATP-binding protein [Candidatus Nitrosocosmicus sp.]|nr:ATP-binding protein [Candidatus Nitrosocosmicus sp.]